MRTAILTLICAILFGIQAIHAQNTIGLLSYNPSKAYDGYNLMYPHNQPNVYLLDNCGEIAHVWEGDTDRRPGNTAYIMEDGSIVLTYRPASFAGDRIWAGGGGASIEIRDWDNNLEWSYTLNDSTGRLHHDISIVPKNDGFNILAISWEVVEEVDAIAAGRDPEKISAGEIWPDYIFEIDPGNDEIVWEWHAWDHLIQDFDDTKANFGIIADNPGKIDVNHDFSGTGAADWLHSNALDYDPINDLVLLCVPYYSEIWVIDHSTNTQEAAGSAGGFSGKGGDLLYRWGNPQLYDQGDSTDQKLFFAHDAAFIDDFIAPFDPDFGNISVFNNRAGADFSTIGILDHGFDMYTFSFPFADGVFGPENLDFESKHPVDSTLMFSTGLSSVQLLPNNNILVCVGRFGYSFEMTPDKEIVWEYKTPLRGGSPLVQGDSTEVNDNLTFRMKRYPTDFQGFEGKDLSPKGWIEQDPNMTFCDDILFTTEFLEEFQLEIFPNPASDMITLKWEAGKYVDIAVFDLMGRAVTKPVQHTGGRTYIDTSNLDSGIYVIIINGKQAGKFMVSN